MKNKTLLLLFLLCFFCTNTLFAREVALRLGSAIGRDISDGGVCDTDILYHDINENLTIGFRLSLFKAQRKEYKIGTGYCRNESFMSGCRYCIWKNKNFEFDTKFFIGLGVYSREGKAEGQKEVTMYKTASSWGCDLSVGLKYNLTKRFGIGLDLGYKHSQGYGHKTDDKFNLSGMSITMNLLNYKV
jgi:hypothetical protein